MILIWLQSSGFSDPFVSQFVGGRRTGPDVVRTADKGISTVKKKTHTAKTMAKCCKHRNDANQIT